MARLIRDHVVVRGEPDPGRQERGMGLLRGVGDRGKGVRREDGRGP